MNLDVATLALAGGIVAFASGVFLLINWSQDRAAWGAFWLGVANSGTGIGIALLALDGVVHVLASKILGPLLLDLSAAFAWIAARASNRGTVKPGLPIGVVGTWLAISICTGILFDEQYAAVIRVALSGSFYAAAAIEFWIGRWEVLRGRWSMIGLLGLQAVALGLAAVPFWYAPRVQAAPSIGWFGLIHFVGIIYAVGSAASLITMLKERSEARHRAAALTDPLTGLSNRRGFMTQAERLLQSAARAESPTAMLALDLDAFKRINDSFGHPTGDRVLQVFANSLSRSVRPADIVGRIGGEEFGALLPGCDIEAAMAIAARIRSTFQGDAEIVDGHALGATVSVGVAMSDRYGHSLFDMISGADRALYRAKELGRNRVMLDQDDRRGIASEKILRIA